MCPIMIQYWLLPIFNEYYTQIITFFEETDAEQIQIQTIS